MRKKEKPENDWSLYIVETECGKLYTGITKDVEQRFEEHKSSNKGAKFFRSAKPKKIVFTRKNLSHSEALKLEYSVKKLTKAQKLTMIKSGKLPVA